MLSKELYDGLSDKDLAISCFMSCADKKIRRLTFFDEDDYGCGVNVYLMSKKSFTSPAQALAAGWLMQYLWEEDIAEDKTLGKDEAEKIYSEAFSHELKKYKYRPMSEKELKKLISSAIKPIVEKTKAVQTAAGESDCVEFLSEPGIYVDKKYTVKNAYILKSKETYIDGVYLYRQKNSAGKVYNEVFFETDEKFALILE